MEETARNCEQNEFFHSDQEQDASQAHKENEVMEMVALLCTYQFDYARHLYRRSSCSYEISRGNENDEILEMMELLWSVTKVLLRKDSNCAVFPLLASGKEKFKHNIKMVGYLDDIVRFLRERQENILGSAYSNVDAAFAARQLGLDGGADEAVQVLTGKGWIISSEGSPCFLQPPPLKSASSATNFFENNDRSVFANNDIGGDALKQMIEVVSFLEYKRLNE